MKLLGSDQEERTKKASPDAAGRGERAAPMANGPAESRRKERRSPTPRNSMPAPAKGDRKRSAAGELKPAAAASRIMPRYRPSRHRRVLASLPQTSHQTALWLGIPRIP